VTVNLADKKTRIDFSSLPADVSPVYYAVTQHDKEFLNKALEAGFPLFESDGKNAFDCAIQTHQYEMAAIIAQKLFGVNAKQLFERLDPDTVVSGLVKLEKEIYFWEAVAMQFNRMTAAAQAAAVGNMAVLKTFNPEDLKRTDLNGLTPLHYALIHGHKDAVEFLKGYSDKNFVTIGGNSYLHFAAMHGNCDLVQSILSMGIDINVLNNRGSSPLHYMAAACPLPDRVSPLVKQGALLNIKNAYGATPLTLLYAKAVQRTPALMTSGDLKLALVQSIWLGLSLLSVWHAKNKEVFGENTILARVAGIVASSAVFTITSFVRQMQVYNLSSTKKMIFNQFVSPTNFVFEHLSFLPDGTPTSNPLLRCLRNYFTPYAIGKNSYEGLKRCMNQFKYRPTPALKAAGVHLFNLSIGLIDFAQHYRDLIYLMRMFWPDDGPCALPKDLSSAKSELEFAANPGFRPLDCPEHAKVLLAGKNGKFSDKRFTQEGCKYVNSLYRPRTLLLHPDKNPQNIDLATKATNNLAAAKDKFCKNPTKPIPLNTP